jgi:hypothetical protein
VGQCEPLTIGPVTLPAVPPPPPPPTEPDEPTEPTEPTEPATSLPAAVQYPTDVIHLQPGAVLQLVAVKQADGSVRIALLPSAYIGQEGFADVLYGMDGVSLPGVEVIWAAAGGTIDSGGRFVAGSTYGEHVLFGRVPDMDVYTDSLKVSVEAPAPPPGTTDPGQTGDPTPSDTDDDTPPTAIAPACGAAGAVEWLALAMCCLLMGRLPGPLTGRGDVRRR